MKFLQGFLKTAVELDAQKGSAISKGFTGATGMSGLKQSWGRLKGAVTGTPAPPPPAPPTPPGIK